MEYKKLLKNIMALLIIAVVSVATVHSEEIIIVDDNNPTSISELATSSPLPNIGEGIMLTAIEVGNTIILTWSAVDEAIAYEIYAYNKTLIYLGKTTETTYKIVKNAGDITDDTIFIVFPVYEITRRGHRLKKGGVEQ
ncbi:MAG: hypothetical protein DRH57_08890 [Candidatus Cloacimonadota bacterium]|nr:MAG: hypothetical protein DRH57_08890 [Candidatus Cloacimonadota bacterium]